MQTIAELASALVAAHDGGAKVGAVPEALVPADLDAVYATQDEIISQIGPVGAWKVAAGLGDPPLCSPIPANRCFVDGDRIDGARHKIFLAEIEVAVRLGADIVAGANTFEVERAIASIHPAIELIGNPFTDRDPNRAMCSSRTCNPMAPSSSAAISTAASPPRSPPSMSR
ncbi:hypothetical protein [Devosia sediminis]|uniref:Uncharacterized protein n=1 Tax=Devosia sediminis TaxID=2798801 RepID=A0A934IW06_9HYPH|nr:hypothetical protein [Devosia sediminis]MBJ3786126.1 hypothetical protein [Devosia sediminis]